MYLKISSTASHDNHTIDVQFLLRKGWWEEGVTRSPEAPHLREAGPIVGHLSSMMIGMVLSTKVSKKKYQVF